MENENLSWECPEKYTGEGKEAPTNTKTITVYEALSERKILRDRIAKIANGSLECTFVYNPKTKSVLNGTPISKEDVTNISISRIDKLAGLIDRYELFCQLIDESNAKTPITIGNKTYSSKASAMAVYGVIDKKIAIYEGIKQRIVDNIKKISDYSSRNLSEDKIADYISKLTLGQDVDQSVIDGIRENYIKQNTLELIDPKDMKTKVDDILEELYDFKDRFNTEMNKSNLQEFITVPLD